jgi:hypothetical protein
LIHSDQEVASIIPDIEKQRLYRGKGGEFIRHAVCQLIEAMSVARISVAKTATSTTTTAAPKAAKAPTRVRKEKSTSVLLQDTLDENLKHPNEEIQFAAVAALRQFCLTYYTFPPKKAAFDLVDRYIKIVATDPNPAARRFVCEYSG